MEHGLLHTLDRAALAAAATDRRWPKWSTMCQLRLLGNPVLNGACIRPNSDATSLRTAIASVAEATNATRLMVRSDGGVETHAYYRGGNSFPLQQVEAHAARLLAGGRAVILLEPTSRFANQLSIMLRMDRPMPGRPGAFTVEALGPGYDVGDLTRGGITPQVTISIEAVTWHRYEKPWWSDLHVARSLSASDEHARRQARLCRLGHHLRTVGELTALNDEDDVSATAARWLQAHGHLDLWESNDPTMRVIRRTPAWFESAFLIAATHPNRNWRCLVTSLSDLGDGRIVYWDVVDAAHKYALAPAPHRRLS
jgi:hypothetical protein